MFRVVAFTFLLAFCTFCSFAQTIDDFVPINHKITQLVIGRLNADTLTDCALLIENTEKMDSQKLIVLFKNIDNSYTESFTSSDLISVRYSNEIEIQDGKLFITIDMPWHGININYYTLCFKSGDWVCLDASSKHFDGEMIGQNWENKINFQTGEYSIAHSIDLLDGSTKTRKKKGQIKNSKPPTIFQNNIFEDLTINHLGLKYYIMDRNNLWTENEISGFMPIEPIENDIVIGTWINQNNKKIVLTFEKNEQFVFLDFNHAINKFETLRGYYKANGETVKLTYFDRPFQTFKLIKLNGIFHIQKKGDFDFIKN